MGKKAFEKIQYSFIIKTLSEQAKEQNNLKLIKAICKNKSKKLQLTLYLLAKISKLPH